MAPTMALAQRAGLADLVARRLTLKAEGGVNAHLKIPALVAGMVAGAASTTPSKLPTVTPSKAPETGTPESKA